MTILLFEEWLHYSFLPLSIFNPFPHQWIYTLFLRIQGHSHTFPPSSFLFHCIEYLQSLQIQYSPVISFFLLVNSLNEYEWVKCIHQHKSGMCTPFPIRLLVSAVELNNWNIPSGRQQSLSFHCKVIHPLYILIFLPVNSSIRFEQSICAKKDIIVGERREGQQLEID